MNFNNPHPSDEIIERELQALRQPASSVQGLGDAIMAMKAAPARTRFRLNPWLVRFGSVGMAAVAITVGVSITTPKAYAGELRAIAAQAENQPAKYMKAYQFNGRPQPLLITELWTDHNQEKFLQYRDGKLEAADLRDGRLRHFYTSGDPAVGIPSSASIDLDVSEHFPIESIESMLNSEFFRKHKIVKQSNVILNGKSYDYYDFANGYFRLWVDPKTKLPAQREIYDHGKTLWERDVYNYAASFPAETFTPPIVNGMEYFDYPAARAKLEESLAAAGTTQKVGNVTVTLKAILQDHQSVTALFTSNGDQGKVNDGRRMPLPGVRFMMQNFGDNEITIAKPAGLKNERMYLASGTSLKNLETIKIGVWSKDKFIGFAEFPFKNVFEAPYASALLARPVAGVVGTAQTVKDAG